MYRSLLEAKAFGCCLHADVERCQLDIDAGGLGVKLVQCDDEALLCGCECHACCVSAELALFDPLLRREPVPDGNIQCGAGRIPKITYAFSTAN